MGKQESHGWVMARYRKVDPRVWDDDTFVDFDDLKRTLWLLLLTGPAVDAVPGLQVGGAASLAETLRRPVEPIGERLGELLREGLVNLDSRARLIRIPNAPKYNEPDNPNQVTGWFRAWESIPESPLKYDHIDSIREACGVADRRKSDGKTAFMERFETTFGTICQPLPEPLPKPLPEPLPEPLGDRARMGARSEQEQEQEHKFRPPDGSGAAPVAGRKTEGKRQAGQGVPVDARPAQVRPRVRLGCLATEVQGAVRRHVPVTEAEPGRQGHGIDRR